MRHASLGRRRAARATALVLLATAALFAPHGPAAVAAPGDPGAAARAATAKAKRGKHRVEMESERTESSTLYANPDGSFTLESSLVPVRVKQAGKWVAADATLRRNPDGSLSPRAALTPMRFSGGGNTAFATIGEARKQVNLGWSAKLPVPEVSGATAIYREVLPGVDLRVEADVTGFTHLLVVKSRAAAANPALDRISFPLTTHGVTTRADAKEKGVVSAVDDSGGVILRGSAMMWDSRTMSTTSKATGSKSTSSKSTSTESTSTKTTKKRPEPRETGPGETEPRRAFVGVETSAKALTVVPDKKLLRGAATTFPVLIDPVWQTTYGKLNHWSTVSSNASSPLYNQGLPSSSNSYAGEIKVGKSPEDGGFVVRTFFEFNTSRVARTNVSKATFSVKQTWSASYCGDKTARLTQVWGTHDTDQNTTWNTSWNSSRSGWYTAMGASGSLKFFNSSKCPTGPAEFDATAYVQSQARAGQARTTLGLRAKNEGDTSSWKRYDKGTAQLSIKFNSYPSAPDQMSIDAQACNTGKKLWVRTRTPQLKARVTDPDTGQPMTGRLYWSPSTSAISSSRMVSRSNLGNPGIAQANTSASLADGDYYFQSYANDQINDSQPSPRCAFTVDATPPPKPTGVSSTLYPDKNPHAGLGQPDLFTFKPPATRTDFDHYCYTVGDTTDSTSCKPVSADASTGVGQVLVYPVKQGVNALRVWSVDKAGNLSKGSGGSDTDFFLYEFGVGAGSPPAAHFPLDEGTGGTANDAYTAQPDVATLAGSAAWVAGRGGVGSALSLDGSTAYAATAGSLTGRDAADTADVALRTDQSFTVSAWARLTTKTVNRTVVSQDGSHAAAYNLEYATACDCWRFSVNQTDVAAPTVTAAAGPSGAVPNRWTQLTGVYDSVGKTIKLYVNGKLTATTNVPVAMWNATGPVNIGRGRLNNAATAYFAGTVDDVRFWNRALVAADALALYYPAAPIVSAAATDVTVGTPFGLTLSSGGDTNVKKFKYYTSIADVHYVNANTDGTPVTVQVTVTDTDVPYVGAYAVYDNGTADGALSDPGRTTLRVHQATSISGTIIDGDTLQAASGVTVTLEPGDLTVTTDSSGRYSITGLTPGDFEISANTGTTICAKFATTKLLSLQEGPTTLNLAISPQGDEYGYTCSLATKTYAPATTAISDTPGHDHAFTLPFTFNYYGTETTTLYTSDVGVASIYPLASGAEYTVRAMPDMHSPNGMMAPLWRGHLVRSMYTSVLGTAPNRQFVIEWRDVASAGGVYSFELIIGENQTISYAYKDVTTAAIADATVGMESPGATTGLQFQQEQPRIANGQVITFTPPDAPTPLGNWTVSGQVTDPHGAPVDFEAVTIYPGEQTAYTDSNGNYQFTGVENGDYTLTAAWDQHCDDIASAEAWVEGDTGADLQLQPQHDAYGYQCSGSYDDFQRLPDALPLTGDDAVRSVTLPFAFPYYGADYSTAWVDTNGLVSFADPGGSHPARTSIPDPGGVPLAAAPFWADMVVDSAASVHTGLVGTAPNRQFGVEWRNVYAKDYPDSRFDVEAFFGEQGAVTFVYDSMSYTDMGTIGISGPGGTDGFQYSDGQADAVWWSGAGIVFRPPGSGDWTLSGTIRHPDGTPAEGAYLEDSDSGWSWLTGVDGRFELTGLNTGNHHLDVAAEPRCGATTTTVVHVETNDDVDIVATDDKKLSAVSNVSCTIVPDTAFVSATTAVSVSPTTTTAVTLPFPFTIYGQTHSTAWVDAFGALYLTKPDDDDLMKDQTFWSGPGDVIAPLSGLINMDSQSSVRTSVTGTAPNRQFVVEWHNVMFDAGPRFSFEALLSENGTVTFNYTGLSAVLDAYGSQRTVAGVSDSYGGDALTVSYWDDWLRDNEAVVITRYHDADPPGLPTVSAPQFDQRYALPKCDGAGAWCQGAGVSGSLTITANGTPDVAGFLAGDTYPPTESVGISDIGGEITVDAVPKKVGLNHFYARSFDTSDNLGPIYDYQYWVGNGTPATGVWSLGEGTGSTSADGGASSVKHPATLTGVTWSTGRRSGSSAATFNGTSSYGATDLKPDTSKSFSVGAWVKLGDKTTDRPVLSRTSTGNPSFTLLYQKSTDKWVAQMPSAASGTVTTWSATSSAAAQSGVWTHLTVTYDATAKKLTLYVNGGAPVTTASVTGFANTGGTTYLGRSPSAWFSGSIGDVRVWDRAVDATEIAALAAA